MANLLPLPVMGSLRRLLFGGMERHSHSAPQDAFRSKLWSSLPVVSCRKERLAYEPDAFIRVHEAGTCGRTLNWPSQLRGQDSSAGRQAHFVEHIIVRCVPRPKIVVFFHSSRTEKLLERRTDGDTITATTGRIKKRQVCSNTRIKRRKLAVEG